MWTTWTYCEICVGKSWPLCEITNCFDYYWIDWILTAEFHGWIYVILIEIRMVGNFRVMVKKLSKQFLLILLVT